MTVTDASTSSTTITSSAGNGNDTFRDYTESGSSTDSSVFDNITTSNGSLYSLNLSTITGHSTSAADSDNDIDGNYSDASPHTEEEHSSRGWDRGGCGFAGRCHRAAGNSIRLGGSVVVARIGAAKAEAATASAEMLSHGVRGTESASEELIKPLARTAELFKSLAKAPRKFDV